MSRADRRGMCVSGASVAGVDGFETALADLLRGTGDPMTTVDAVLADDRDFAMAHALKAYLLLGGLDGAAAGRAAEIVPTLRAVARTDRERLHAAAVAAYAQGELDDAGERLEDVLIEHPRDVLALQQAHLLDLYRGDLRSLRDRIARFRWAWSPGLPGYHAVLAMHAFGLEECGDTSQAEDLAREALALEPRDVWAHHAVAHVLEAQGRREAGIAWMEEREGTWATGSFLAVHNWWHRALYHLDLDQADRALAIYDERMRLDEDAGRAELVDASGLLWRLALRGIDVGPRWAALAEDWAPAACDGWYAASDVHAMMAFVGAGRWDLADQILATMRRRAERSGSNRAMTREVGLPLARALYAFGRRNHTAAVTLLRPLRPIAHRFGGSHVQRDVIDLTLLEAARRDGQGALLRALAHERLAAKPETPQARRYLDAATALRYAT